MADENTTLEPTIDNHETKEHSDETAEQAHVESTESAESEQEPVAESDIDACHGVTDADAEAEAEDPEKTEEDNADVDAANEDELAEEEHPQEHDSLSEHGMDMEQEEAHDESVHEDEHDVHTTTAHERLQQALADTENHHDAEDTRRSSNSSSRSGGSTSTHRSSTRTEALIKAAARAVVAKINSDEDESDDIEILDSVAESETTPDNGPSSMHEEVAEHTATDEEADYEHDGELGADDDVFSDHSPRTSLGSFEHNSGASNNGSEYDQQKIGGASPRMSDAAEAAEAAEADDAPDSEAEQDENYAAETGSTRYSESHRSPRVSAVSAASKGPRVNDVISRMSQYDRHRRDEDEGHYDGEAYYPHTVRGAPRPAFRTPSSVRAIQMSSPIFDASPRSSARRRHLDTAEGADERQSMGSVATYSSLPNSPSKRSTPTRFKVFRRPEPAPLVLLHATIMPTRWGWSDVLRDFDEMMSHPRPKRNTASLASDDKDTALVEDVPADLSSFEPSAALKRLHSTWCQLQEYSLGADTVTERGVLLPHPQNDYEVLEERLLEALELPVRRRARILECGHYLGPADVDDDDDEDDDYYDDEHRDDDDEDSSSKRHWCPECRSDIRYESLGAERVFRVKVYASNGLMTVGAWDACWREMERVDVEIEPIVADPSLQRELNLLRNLQQQDAYRREEEERQAMYDEEVDEEEVEEEEEEEEEKNVASEQVSSYQEQYPEHDEHLDTRGAVDNFHLSPATLMAASSPLHNSPVEPPATTSTDREPEADHRRWAAEERLREIYGRTPQSDPRTMSLSPQMDPSSAMPATVGTVLATTHRDMHDHHASYGLSPSSPSAEAYERREERRHRQYSAPGPSDRGFSEYGGPAPAFPPHPSAYNNHHGQGHPQQPYDSASFPELLMAAVRVFLRDRKHIAITVLSAIVIVLATLRAPSASVGGAGGAGVAPILDNTAPPKAAVQHAVVHSYAPVPAALAATAGACSAVEGIAASVAASIETTVETVVQKTTVKVFETVTEVATETAIETSTKTSTTTATEVATTTATEASVAEPIESTEYAEAVSTHQPEETCAATGVVFAPAAQQTSAA